MRLDNQFQSMFNIQTVKLSENTMVYNCMCKWQTMQFHKLRLMQLPYSPSTYELQVKEVATSVHYKVDLWYRHDVSVLYYIVAYESTVITGHLGTCANMWPVQDISLFFTFLPDLNNELTIILWNGCLTQSVEKLNTKAFPISQHLIYNAYKINRFLPSWLFCISYIFSSTSLLKSQSNKYVHWERMVSGINASPHTQSAIDNTLNPTRNTHI